MRGDYERRMRGDYYGMNVTAATYACNAAVAAVCMPETAARIIAE